MSDKSEIVKLVKNNIVGRYANAGNVSDHIFDLVEQAGDGDYLEIGVLNGGSISAVALFKKSLGQTGMCYGVDPFDGYYFETKKLLIDKKSGVAVTLETAQGNVDKFGLDNVQLIRAKSPNFEFDKQVTVAYIDGDHSFDGVMADWQKVRGIATRFAIFHDYMAIDSVTQACDHIAAEERGWHVIRKDKFAFVLERS